MTNTDPIYEAGRKAGYEAAQQAFQLGYQDGYMELLREIAPPPRYVDYRKVCRQAHGEPEDSICYLCGEPNDEDATVDHLIPQSCADTSALTDIHTPGNLRWVHGSCNSRRRDRLHTAEEFWSLAEVDGLTEVWQEAFASPEMQAFIEELRNQPEPVAIPAKLVNTAGLADIHGVAPATVRSWVKRGKVTPLAKDNGTLLFDPEAVVREMFLRGETAAEAARQSGMAQATVYRRYAAWRPDRAEELPMAEAAAIAHAEGSVPSLRTLKRELQIGQSKAEEIQRILRADG